MILKLAASIAPITVSSMAWPSTSSRMRISNRRGFGAEGYRLEAVGIDAASGKKGLVTTGEKGRVDAGGHKLSAVEPIVPVYGAVGGHFALNRDRGHRLLVRFHANDLGHAAFDREALKVTPRGLVLIRYDTAIRFIRVRP